MLRPGTHVPGLSEKWVLQLERTLPHERRTVQQHGQTGPLGGAGGPRRPGGEQGGCPGQARGAIGSDYDSGMPLS